MILTPLYYETLFVFSEYQHYLLGNKGCHKYNGNQQYKCEKCGKLYKTIIGLQSHKCNMCTVYRKIFASSQRLTQHKCMQQQPVNSDLKCQKCFQ